MIKRHLMVSFQVLQNATTVTLLTSGNCRQTPTTTGPQAADHAGEAAVGRYVHMQPNRKYLPAIMVKGRLRQGQQVALTLSVLSTDAGEYRHAGNIGRTPINS